MADIRTDHRALSPRRLNKQDNHLVGAITHVRLGNLCWCEREWTRCWSRCLYSVWPLLFHHVVYFFPLSRRIFFYYFPLLLLLLFSPALIAPDIAGRQFGHNQTHTGERKVRLKLMKITFLEQRLPTVVTLEDITRPHWSHGNLLRDNLEPRNLIIAASSPVLHDAERRNRHCDTSAYIKSHDRGNLKEEASEAAAFSGTCSPI